MKFLRIYLLLLILLIVQVSQAQKKPSTLSNLHVKEISTAKKIVKIDSLSIVPNTVTVFGVSTASYKIDEVNGLLTWVNKPAKDTVRIAYRTFPYQLNAVVQHHNFDSIRFNFIRDKPFTFDYNNQKDNPLLDFGNINYNGSFGRGISFGNNQDAVLTSSLNLQLSGFIGDSLEISAAITDNNIPIQPDGNTQNLQDFDKVYIQVKKKGWQANFGDIDLRQTKSYFLSFYKRLEGASFITTDKIGEMSNTLLVSGSVAKGKFNTNILTPIDGNQGPYRLQDANNDLYFTVLAGSEKVTLDGVLLQRGEDQDYIINYNTAELTFTPKHMITKDSRIQVNFEYSDQNYLNSNLYLSDEITINKRLTVSLGAFSNQDAKNSPINQLLSTDQKQFLANIGDSINHAYYSSAVLDTFAAGKVLYKRLIDTTVNGITYDSVYRYSTSTTDTLYNLAFTFIGPGQGDYTQSTNNAANGTVYSWVPRGPNNTKQGDSEPVILLVTPKKQQMITVGAEYKINTKTTLKSEFAYSNYDVNLFSALGKGSDGGLAAKLQLTNQDKKLRLFSKAFVLQTQLGYEYEQNTFKPLEVLRTAEFYRNWSLATTVEAADEHLSTAAFQLNDSSKNNKLNYSVTNYNRSDNFNGFLQVMEHTSIIHDWKISDKFSLTTTNSSFQKDVYFRPSVDVSKQFKQLKNILIGASFINENNRLQDKQPDTLNALSFAYTQWQAYIKSDTRKLNNFGLTFFTRNDWLPLQAQLSPSSKSTNLNIFANLLKSDKNQLKFNITYRQLHIINPLLTSQTEDHSLLGRTEYVFKNWKGLLTGNVLYEVGSGQQQKLAFSYIQVPAGQGQYTWIDYNGDGVQQLNEFQIALFTDQANYIRVNTPTNQYVTANYIQFNYSLDINPRAVINSFKATGFKKFLTRISTSSALQVNKKDVSTGQFEFNPFAQNLVDTNIISLSSFLSNTFYFNRTNTKWGFDITHSLSNNKALLTYGVQSNKIQTITFKTRWNLNRNFTGNLSAHSGLNEQITPAFSNQNYSVTEKGAEPSLSYIYKSNFRLTVAYTYNDKKNTASVGFNEHAVNNALSLDLKYNVLSNSTISSSFSSNTINFSSASGGSANSAVGYIMLGGLAPGQNYLWDIQYTKRLGGNIEMSLQYEGRKPGTDNVINTGRASLRAIL